MQKSKPQWRSRMMCLVSVGLLGGLAASGVACGSSEQQAGKQIDQGGSAGSGATSGGSAGSAGNGGNAGSISPMGGAGRHDLPGRRRQRLGW